MAQDPGEEMQLTVRTNCKFSLKFAAHFFQFYFGEFGCSSVIISTWIAEKMASLTFV